MTFSLAREGDLLVRITDSKVGLFSQQEWSQTFTRIESLRAWSGGRGPGGAPGDGASGGRPGAGDRLDFSDEARRMLQAAPPPPSATDPLRDDLLARLDPDDRVRILILQAMLGIQVQIAPNIQGAPDAVSNGPGQGTEGWGVDYQLHERYEETESLSFAAEGVIQTADGQQIAFSVELNMSRQYVEESHLRIRAGDAARPVDPLVINYSGTAAELTERKFRFDLQVGGQVEQIPFLRQGSGFLALDQNGDGRINNGSELFGPTTGDGFAELAQYDSDGNRWIDAADPIFDRLRMWTKDASGKDQLFALGKLGIGAIYVGSVDAGFSLTNSANQTRAINRQAGVYVRENGTAGTVQQLDIVV